METCSHAQRKAQIDAFLRDATSLNDNSRLAWVSLFAELADGERMQEQVTRITTLELMGCGTTRSGPWTVAPSYGGDWRIYRASCSQCPGWISDAVSVGDAAAILLGRPCTLPEHPH